MTAARKPAKKSTAAKRARKPPATPPRATPRRTEPILRPSAPDLDVTLQNGNTARLIDPAALTNGQRRPIIVASEDYRMATIDPSITRELQKAVAQRNDERISELVTAIDLDSGEVEALKVSDVLITVLVAEWSLELDLPSEHPIYDEDGHLTGSTILDDITAHDYDALRWATARLMPLLKLQPGTAPQSRPTKSSGRSKTR